MDKKIICPQCGYSNEWENHFCVNCSAALDGYRLSIQNRKKNRWKWILAVLFAGIVFAAGIIIGIFVYVRSSEKAEELVGRRMNMNWDSVEIVFDDENIAVWSDNFHSGPRQYWYPQWSILEFGTQKVGDYLFEYLYDTINVYTEDLSMYRQLDDYEIIRAQTDGKRVYMHTAPLADTGLNDQLAVWDLETNQMVFLDMIVMWPDIPVVDLSGGSSRGIYFFRSLDREYADWYRYDFNVGTINTGSHQGALLYVGEYEGEEFFISKDIPMTVGYNPDLPGTLRYTTSEGSEDTVISYSVTQVRVFENDVYFLENRADGVIFKKFDIETKKTKILCGDIIHATDFKVILGGAAAVFRCEPYLTDIRFSLDMCGFVDFNTRKVYELENVQASVISDGYNGYIYDRDNNKLYCYDPLTSEVSEIYEAPDGWFVYSIVEMDRDTVCVRLTSESAPVKTQHRKIQLS